MKGQAIKTRKTVKKATHKNSSMIDAIIEKVKTYVKDDEVINREAIIKYTALANVGIYGLRKSGWLRGMLLPAIVTLATERLVESISEKQVA